MRQHPQNLASFKTALLEGDRRLVRRRRRRVAGGGVTVVAVAVLAAIVVAPLGGGALDASALAAEARQALARPGLALHSETEVVLPGGRVQNRISRWSLGDRSRTVSVSGGRTVEQAVDGRQIRVRLRPGGPVDTLQSHVATPDPLLDYRRLLALAAERGSVDEVDVNGVDAYRLTVPGGSGRVPQVAYLRRSDRLPLRVELAGGATLRFRVLEWLPENRVRLELD